MPTAKAPAQQKEPTRKAAPKKPLQRKLAVGAAGDRFEQEADRVAQRAVRGGQSATAIPPTITSLGAQRVSLPTKPTAPKEDEQRGKPAAVQRKPTASVPRADEDEQPGSGAGKRAQRQATDGGGSGGGSAPASVEGSIGRMQAGGGSSLDGRARNLMESRLGHDFSGVRMHHGREAASAAQALNARAFTVGRDVFFNAGEYRPHTPSGQELIAHELTHTVQQGGGSGVPARRRAQRAVPPGTGTTGQDEEEPATPPSNTFAAKQLKGARVDATPLSDAIKGTITLPTLELPSFGGALKGTAGDKMTPVAAAGRKVPELNAPFVLPPVVETRKPDTAGIWTDYAAKSFAPATRDLLGKMSAQTPDLATLRGPATDAPTYAMKFRNSRGSVFLGTLDQLAVQDALLRPQWTTRGVPLEKANERLDADHFLEFQLGGLDAGENLWLLEAGWNRSVGAAIKGRIEKNLRTILKEVTSASSIPEEKRPVDINDMKRHWTLRFDTVQEGSFAEGPRNFWTPTQIGAGEHLKGLAFMTGKDLGAIKLSLEDQGVQPSQILVFPRPDGGAWERIRIGKDRKVEGSPRLFGTIEVLSGEYLPGATDQQGSELLKLNIRVFKTKKKVPIAEKEGPIIVDRLPQFGLAGYVTHESLMEQLSKLEFKPMSPLTFTDIGLDSNGVLVGTGEIASTKALFPGLHVPLTLYGDRIAVSFPVPTDKLSFGPLSVTEAAVDLGVGDQGFFIQGYALIAINGLGSGVVTATGEADTLTFAGSFDLDTDFLTPARVDAKYDVATDTLTASTTLGVDSGKVPGVDSGSVTVGITRDAVNVAGTITLAAPLAGTVLTVGYTQQEGVKIGAENIPLPFSNLPAVQNATMSIAAARRPDGSGWTFAGAGTATLAVTGATGTIELRYEDGKVTMTAVGQVARGPAAGTLNFTATNSPLDEAGNPVDGPPTPTIRVWGRGTVTLQFGPILRGTAGVELTPDNRVILSGEIALPPEFPVFDRLPYHRELFNFEPPEFPIWGVSVAGVGVGVFAYVRGNVSFDAYVGAGVIRGAAVTATLDLDHPELATVRGHGEFFVPAYAGLTLGIRGGLRARAAVAFAEGEVGLDGTLGIQADASAALDLDWNPSTGLALETTIAAHARPKFSLDAVAEVRIGVDLLVTDVTKSFGPWTKNLGEFGPDLELGVSFPVRWSEASGLDLNLDNVVIQQPTLDPKSLMKGVFNELVG